MPPLGPGAPTDGPIGISAVTVPSDDPALVCQSGHHLLDGHMGAHRLLSGATGESELENPAPDSAVQVRERGQPEIAEHGLDVELIAI